MICETNLLVLKALFNRLCPAKKGVRKFAPVMLKRLEVCTPP